MNTSQSRVYLIFICIAFFTAVFAGFTLYRVTLDRSLPKINISDEDSALRGDIITSDGFSVATSQKLYSAVVNTRNIDPNKKELFINLYSLYSGADPKKVEKILKSKGAVTLSKDLNAKDAAHLRELARKLYRTKVFIPYEDPKTGIVTTQGLDVTESGEKRSYIAGDTLTPLIGYTSKTQEGKITKASGVKGIEKFYQDQLDDITNESLKGPRDLSNTIILSGESKLKRRKDGYNVVLNINLRLQQMLEKMIDERAKSLIAKEIVLAVMEAKTGKLLALTSTKRYNPGAITQKDYEALNSSASEYAYEMGSVMKPIIFSLALQENKINPLENINVYGGKYKLGRRTITDSHKADSLSAEEVIIRSSNIGMINVIERLDDASIYNGLRNFGFAQKTGVDLSHEQTGKIPQIRDLKNRTYKATLSYGYGIQATFMQLLSAYNAINNGGVMMEPRLFSHLERDAKKYFLQNSEPKQVLSKEVADKMRAILVKVVDSPSGTGRAAKIPGLVLGGKTGTAHIATTGGYSDKRYNASFFGFASDDEGHNYTIGVLVREPMRPYPYYFASWSALPVFKQAAEILVENDYLSPSEAFSRNKNDIAATALD